MIANRLQINSLDRCMSLCKQYGGNSLEKAKKSSNRFGSLYKIRMCMLDLAWRNPGLPKIDTTNDNYMPLKCR